jgi:hypothetical protein
MTAYLIDPSGAPIAALDVSQAGGRFDGTVALAGAPGPVRQLFAEFEEIVEGQMLSLLDQIQSRIMTLGLRVQFEDGSFAEPADLQVFPSTGAVSFTSRSLPPSGAASPGGRIPRLAASDSGQPTTRS